MNRADACATISSAATATSARTAQRGCDQRNVLFSRCCPCKSKSALNATRQNSSRPCLGNVADPGILRTIGVKIQTCSGEPQSEQAPHPFAIRPIWVRSDRDRTGGSGSLGSRRRIVGGAHRLSAFHFDYLPVTGYKASWFVSLPNRLTLFYRKRLCAADISRNFCHRFKNYLFLMHK